VSSVLLNVKSSWEGIEMMSIRKISKRKYGVFNIFNQLVKMFGSYDDAFDYLKEIEY